MRDARRPAAGGGWLIRGGRFLGVSLLLVTITGCAALRSVQSLDGESMGSTWSVRYVADSSSLPEIRRAIEARLELVDRQMSTWKGDSNLSQFNSAPAGSWMELPPELFGVTAAALKLAADTGGAYDPTVGPLVDLWGFGAKGTRREPPDAASIAAMRARTGWQRVKLDIGQRRILQAGGTRLDLSSIAPGFAVDLIAGYLGSQRIKDYLVEVGGELRGSGSKPDGSAWQVAVQRPLDNDSIDDSVTPAHVLSLRDASLGSSGDYRHFFVDDGRRYAHRIDPRSGYPLDNAVASVTVSRPHCVDADPLATALSVLGVDAGLTYANQRGIAVLFILRTADGFEERMSAEFARLLNP